MDEGADPAAEKAEKRRRAQEARSLAEQAREAAGQGDDEGAERLFHAAAALGKMSALGEWCRIALKRGEFARALETFERFAGCGEAWVAATGQHLTYEALRVGHAGALDAMLERLVSSESSRDVARPLLLLTRNSASRFDAETVALAHEELASPLPHAKGFPNALAIALRRCRDAGEGEAMLRQLLARDLGDLRSVIEEHLAVSLAGQGRITDLIELTRTSPSLRSALGKGFLPSAIAVAAEPCLAEAGEVEAAREIVNFSESMTATGAQLLARLGDAQSIAIVGNGSSGIGQGAGDAIDSRQMVIRFNNFRIEGFEADYGSRTDLIVRRREDDPSLDTPLRPGLPVLFSGLGMPFGNRDWSLPRRIAAQGIPVGFLPAEPLVELVEVLEAVPTAGLSMVWLTAAIRGAVSRNELFGFTLAPHARLPLIDHYYGAPILCTRHAYDREMQLLNVLVDGLVRPSRWTPAA